MDNVNETYQKLKEKGVKFIEEPHDEAWGGREALFLDPDGNTLEIMQIYWKKYFKISLEGA